MKTAGYFPFLWALGLLFRPALAIDLQPGDIVAPPPNRTVVTVSYVNSQNNDLYRNGVNTGTNPKLESNTALIRLAHTTVLAHCRQSLTCKLATAHSPPMAHLPLSRLAKV